MWFASIWIFTLKLPWELGADFFYRHLLDGDPASNTCSWRWVGGLHTKGKNYAARASNISKFTNGRFSGHMNLASDPMPLEEVREIVEVPLRLQEEMPQKPFIFLITEEDLLPETLPLCDAPKGVVAINATQNRSPLQVSDQVLEFSKAALFDALDRAQIHWGCKTTFCENDDLELESLIKAANEHGVETIVTAYAPVGPTADKLAQLKYKLNEKNINLVQILRSYDEAIWPHATRGFFKVKKQMPKILNRLAIT